MTTPPSFVDSVRDFGLGLDVLDDLFEDAPFGVYLEHPVEGCVYANPMLLAYFGLEWEEFRGLQWARYVVEQDAERIREAIQHYETTLDPIRITYRIRRPDGELRWMQARARAIRDRFSTHLGTIALVDDVTDIRTLRERVAGTQKLEAVGRLAARIAHDFNNLLTVMLASTEMLSERQLDAESIESLRTMDNAIDQAAQITRQLLTLTRHQMGRASISALDDELRALEPLIARTLGEGIDLRLHLDAPEVHVGLDSGQLGQIVLNLATNGHDAMRGYGRLEVRTRVVGEFAAIEVEDEGEGMDSATLARSFEPFFTTKAEGRGTGLGLTTVRDIAEVVGGRVEIHSAPDAGTLVRVELPSVRAEYDSARPHPELGPERHDETVLLVEDKDDLRQSLAYALALRGYQVTSARSLAEARRYLDVPPDVLVTDVMLTDGNGIDLVRELRATTPGLPVVIISGYAGEATIGVDATPKHTQFLPKPFRPRDLLLALNKLLPVRQG
ncbi:MAG: ATP-binding protein [Planctomycetota bacterium]